MIPRLVIAAPASGSGKTTVATGLIAALTAQGLDVSPHKVGPDYIDPGYHALATGRVGRNLDAYLCGPRLVGPLFRHGARGCDIAVVEGVTGLYDGAAGAGEFASTAHVAKLLNAPVVRVVDAASAGRSVAALVHGFVTYDPGVRVGGVILNRVASDRHEEICREAIEETGLPVLGVLRRHADVATPSRHLGLIPVAERHPEAVATVERLGAFERVAAAAFSDGRLARIRKLAGPKLLTSMGPRSAAVLWADGWTPWLRLGALCRGAMAQVPVRQGWMTVVDRAFLRTASRAGVEVHTWTIDDRAEMIRLLDLGVHGIVTDRPDVLREVLAEHGYKLPRIYAGHE